LKALVIYAIPIGSQLTITSPPNDFYETVEENLVSELVEVMDVNENYLDEDYADKYAYECFLSYIAGSRSDRTERRRRRYVLRQNLKISTGISAFVVLVYVYYILFVTTGVIDSLIETPSIILSYEGAAFLLIISLLTYYLIVLAYIIYLIIYLYFERAGREYMRALIADFHIKKHNQE
jgi:hypothetical protein